MKCTACGFNDVEKKIYNAQMKKDLEQYSPSEREMYKNRDALLRDIDDPVPEWITTGFVTDRGPLCACPKCGTVKIELKL